MKLFRSLFGKKQTENKDELIDSELDDMDEEMDTLLVPPRQARFQPDTSPFAAKRTSYKVVDEEEEKQVIASEKFYDESNKLLYHIDYETDPISEKTYLYDASDRLVEEVETGEGMELSRNHFLYEAETTTHYMLISGELYQTTVTIEKPDRFSKVVTREEMEVERQEQIIDGENYTTRFFSLGVLIEVQICTYDELTNTANIEVYDPKDKLVATSKTVYNNLGLKVSKQAYDDKQQLILEETYEYTPDLLLAKTTQYKEQDNVAYTISYEYDENNNLVKEETRSPEGFIISFLLQKFNQQNLMIEEVGRKEGYDFHYKHTYESLSEL